MSRRAIIGRAFAASFLAGIVSPLILAIVFISVSLAIFGRDSLSSLDFLDKFVLVGRFAGTFGSLVWLVASIIAIPCALIIGLVVEWPKSYWLLKRPSGGWCASLLISVFAAEILLHPLWLIYTAARPAPGPDDLGIGNLTFVTLAAAIGGACSAASWWWFVVRPERNGSGVTSSRTAEKLF